MNDDACTRCGRKVPGWEGVHQSDGEGGSLGFVCGRCWAEVLSESREESFEHVEVAPVILEDSQGEKHEFLFRFNPLPRSIEAFELVDGNPGGYRFQVLDEGQPRLVEALLAKMRKALSRQHVEPCDITRGGFRVKDMRVRGYIDWDEEEDGRVPRVVVDGKSLTWDQFGAMMMSFEGWHFDLEISDQGE